MIKRLTPQATTRLSMNAHVRWAYWPPANLTHTHTHTHTHMHMNTYLLQRNIRTYMDSHFQCMRTCICKSIDMYTLPYFTPVKLTRNTHLLQRNIRIYMNSHFQCIYAYIDTYTYGMLAAGKPGMNTCILLLHIHYTIYTYTFIH